MGELTPLLAELKLKGRIEVRAIQELASRLTSVRALEQKVNELQTLNADLNQKLILLNDLGSNTLDKLRGFEGVLALAARVDPTDPPAVLKRAFVDYPTHRSKQ